MFRTVSNSKIFGGKMIKNLGLLVFALASVAKADSQWNTFSVVTKGHVVRDIVTNADGSKTVNPRPISAEINQETPNYTLRRGPIHA